MENSSNSGNQSRFLIAAVLCMLVLFAWSYFFAPKPKPADNSNTATQANTNAPTPAPQATPAPQPVPESIAVTPDTIPNRTITIKTPVYEVTLDSKGAVATSWILLRNKVGNEELPIYADGSTPANEKPLQLISPEALSRTPREVPFRLSTDDQAVNNLVNDRNYTVSEAGDTIQLAPGQEKQIDFKLTDASGVEVTKSFVFRAESYLADLKVNLTKSGSLFRTPNC
jgi:YidC/Oxa1 family membrane protein insertase